MIVRSGWMTFLQYGENFPTSFQKSFVFYMTYKWYILYIRLPALTFMFYGLMCHIQRHANLQMSLIKLNLDKLRHMRQKCFQTWMNIFLHVMACSSSTQRPAGLAEPLIIKYLSQSSSHPSTLSSISSSTFKSTSSNISSSFTSSSSSSSTTTCWHLSVSYQMPLSNLHNIPLPLYFKLLKLNTIAIMI